jgi:site-specific recombinase XerD
VAKENGPITPRYAFFWSTWARPRQGKQSKPMSGKNVWRLCKTYGRIIGYPQRKPHDLRHGVAMECYGQHHDLEQVRALLGHARIETTQVYAHIQPKELKLSVSFDEARALEVLS